MTGLICPHGHYGSCTRCTLQREAREAGEAIGSEAGALVAEAIAEPIRALAAERDVLLSIVGLVMPFVVCASHGGPYDDQSFCAGVWFGKHEALLERGGVIENGILRPGFPVPTPLVPQLDLLAMHHSYAMTATPVEGMEDEWTQVVYTPVAAPPEGDPT